MSENVTAETLLDAEFLRKLERLAISARKVQLGLAKGERKSKRKGSSVEFADYRDYVQGDDLRHVDWNIYGRLNALYLKLFQESEDLTVHLLIDASRSMAYGTPSKIGFATRLAAAIGYVGLIGYDRVSAEAFSQSGTSRLIPCRGKAKARLLLSFLASITPEGATHLAQSTHTYVLRNRAKGVAVLFSDLMDPDGFEPCLRKLQQSGSDCYVVHVLSPDEIDPPIVGDLRLVDSETGEFIEISSSPMLLKRYKDNLTGFCEAVRKFCLARGIGYIFAPSDTSFERLTLEVMRRGGLFR
ncbi:MAG: DUF58 domain-containing protein [Candidatus Hydrogenedentes bacterium]|nr:DUF58 domain-containing protein [Candidatus Hydrogenedentota bacterium]